MSKAMVAAILVASVLSGCAGIRERVCTDLVGPEWTPLAAPPKNADQLLSFVGNPRGPRAWLDRGDDDLMVCMVPFAGGACGTVTFGFTRVNGRWTTALLGSHAVVCAE